MNKSEASRENEPRARREYDFTGGERGKYVERYAAGTNIVVLDPDVALKFKTSEAVNQALRSLMKDAS